MQQPPPTIGTHVLEQFAEFAEEPVKQTVEFVFLARLGNDTSRLLDNEKIIVAVRDAVGNVLIGLNGKFHDILLFSVRPRKTVEILFDASNLGTHILRAGSDDGSVASHPGLGPEGILI